MKTAEDYARSAMARRALPPASMRTTQQQLDFYEHVAAMVLEIVADAKKEGRIPNG